MPHLSVNITFELEINEINEFGQRYVWSISPASNLPTLKFMAKNRDQYYQWIHAFKQLTVIYQSKAKALDCKSSTYSIRHGNTSEMSS